MVTFELSLISSHSYRATLAIQRMNDFEQHDPGAFAIFSGVAQGLLLRHIGLPEEAIHVLQHAQDTLTPGVFKNTNFVFGFSVTPLIWHELVLSKFQTLRGKERTEWAKHAALETYDRIDDDLSDFDIACYYITLCHCLIQLKETTRLLETIDLLYEHTNGYHPDVEASWLYSMGNRSRLRLLEAEASLLEGKLSVCLEKFSKFFDQATECGDNYHLSIAQRRFQEIGRRSLTEGITLPDIRWSTS